MRLLYNARIHTLDSSFPIATVLAVENGTIMALGGEELMQEFGFAQREDMRGQVILPGLVDAHIHLQEYAQSREFIDCEMVEKENILQRVKERIKQIQRGEWVQGHGWNQNNWGGEYPTSTNLDAVAPENPVCLTAKSLHAMWVNSAVLNLAGINSSTEDPINGTIQRDVFGIPTGILFENAIKLVEGIIPEPTPESLAQKFRRIITELWHMGLTGVHDFDQRTCFQALQLLHDRGELRFRVIKSIPFDHLPEAVALGLRSGFGDDFLRIGAVKFFADGALGPHTGAMFEPYVDEPQNRGILMMDQEQIFEKGVIAVEGGLQLAVHAIGDRAIHEVLVGYSRLRAYEREHGLTVLRHRLEHVQTIHPDDSSRLAELNIIASMQPIHATSDMIMAERFLGERSKNSYAWKTQVRHGARLAFGSDAPVESPNPFWGIHAAVTRRRSDGTPGLEGWIPEQRLTVGEAIKGFTLGPAFCTGMENQLGKLSAGYLADLIVVETDPFTCDPAALYDIQPTATMVAGEWVWQS
jgi:Predicted metal-dependent hydrolase with the TIM-barrel fold